MEKYRLVIAATVTVYALSCGVALSETIRTSPFAEARYPASELDLILQSAQDTWRSLVILDPPETFAVEKRLIVEAGLSAHFSYYGKDVIEITGFISNLDGFLSFSYDERKQLVRDTLDFAFYLLRNQVRVFLDEDNILPSGGMQHAHIELQLMYSDGLLENNRGQPLRQLSFQEFGTGVAAYKKGSFWFSRPYYLELAIIDGVAISGDKDEYVKESE